MKRSFSLADDNRADLICDASVLINLIASGFASDIVRALPGKVVIVRQVADEVAAGTTENDEQILRGLVTSGAIQVAELPKNAEDLFLGMVEGNAKSTLDDGEAATIAFAAHRRGVALLDEKKAIRICLEKFPDTLLACTVDLFMIPQVVEKIGRTCLADAVGNALEAARMRVPTEHCQWVIGLIGQERAKRCRSLPDWVRRGIA